ncbi:unnamed protein product [Amoebophrya sp. A120]|nr:unnamed protein product [Amoebophrya sp. A120]|eukprot:GSA120T00015629001.1
MQNALDRASPLVGPAELERRRKIRVDIEELLNQWIRSPNVTGNVNAPRGKVMTIGSSTLELMTEESDIDLVCFLPYLGPHQHLQINGPDPTTGELNRSPLREMWLEDFGKMLQKHEEVKDFVKLDSTANATLCCRFRGVDLDILLCCLPNLNNPRGIPEDFLELNESESNFTTFTNDDVLADLDEPSQRSVNGVRVARLLLTDRSLVSDVTLFKKVLRFVKAWAKARGIYNNISGYFGGITWALCVAKAMMERPLIKDPEQMVMAFFEFFSEFEWQEKDVTLRVHSEPSCQDITLKQRATSDNVWRPRAEGEVKLDVMSVVTPCYPPMNSCHNANGETLLTIDEQFFRSAGLVKRIRETEISSAGGAAEQSQTATDKIWDEFFEPYPFFTAYHHYVRISVDTLEDNREKFCRLKGSVEAKLKSLVEKLAAYHEDYMRAHLYPHNVADPRANEATWFIGIEFEQGTSGQHLDIRHPVAEWVNTVAFESRRDGRIHIALHVQEETTKFRRKSGEGPAIAKPNLSPSSSSKDGSSTAQPTLSARSNSAAAAAAAANGGPPGGPGPQLQQGGSSSSSSSAAGRGGGPPSSHQATSQSNYTSVANGTATATSAGTTTAGSTTSSTGLQQAGGGKNYMRKNSDNFLVDANGFSLVPQQGAGTATSAGIGTSGSIPPPGGAAGGNSTKITRTTMNNSTASTSKGSAPPINSGAGGTTILTSTTSGEPPPGGSSTTSKGSTAPGAMKINGAGIISTSGKGGKPPAGAPHGIVLNAASNGTTSTSKSNGTTAASNSSAAPVKILATSGPPGAGGLSSSGDADGTSQMKPPLGNPLLMKRAGSEQEIDPETAKKRPK